MQGLFLTIAACRGDSAAPPPQAASRTGIPLSNAGTPFPAPINSTWLARDSTLPLTTPEQVSYYRNIPPGPQVITGCVRRPDGSLSAFWGGLLITQRHGEHASLLQPLPHSLMSPARTCILTRTAQVVRAACKQSRPRPGRGLTTSRVTTQVHLIAASPNEMWVLWATGLPCIGPFDTSPSNASSPCTGSTATPAVVSYGTESGVYTATIPGCAIDKVPSLRLAACARAARAWACKVFCTK